MSRQYNYIGGLHPKNENGIHLLKRAGMDVVFNNANSAPNDWDIYTDKLVPSNKKKTLYGPHIDFRFIVTQQVEHPVNFLSDWNCKLAKKFNPALTTLALPFPVDIDKFKPQNKTGLPILYVKRRDHVLVKQVESFLKKTVKKFEVFNYEKGYKEEKYIKAVATAPFAVWLGSHESQGFAMQECMSSACPVFVINVRDLSEEVSKDGHRSWGDKGPFFPATSASYFDERCGVITYPESYQDDFDKFHSSASSFSPRDFIIEKLSAPAVKNLWEETLSSFE